MRVCFHQDIVNVAALCTDLKQHGAVYWHTPRTNFKHVCALVREQGLSVSSLSVEIDGDFLNFMVWTDLLDEGLMVIKERLAGAIVRWQDAGEPVPHSESI